LFHTVFFWLVSVYYLGFLLKLKVCKKNNRPGRKSIGASQHINNIPRIYPPQADYFSAKPGDLSAYGGSSKKTIFAWVLTCLLGCLQT
jgi:hypothetical protein